MKNVNGVFHKCTEAEKKYTLLIMQKGVYVSHITFRVPPLVTYQSKLTDLFLCEHIAEDHVTFKQLYERAMVSKTFLAFLFLILLSCLITMKFPLHTETRLTW